MSKTSVFFIGASIALMFEGTFHAVQLAYCPALYASKLRWKIVALSHGSRICGLPLARMMGRFIDGFSALKSSSGTSASCATSLTSMSRVTVTDWK